MQCKTMERKRSYEVQSAVKQCVSLYFYTAAHPTEQQQILQKNTVSKIVFAAFDSVVQVGNTVFSVIHILN